jgi:hypothetical protein
VARPPRYKKLPGSTGALKAEPGAVIEGLELVGYEIFGGQARAVQDPAERPVFRDVVLRDCKIRDCMLEGAYLDGVTIDGLVVDENDFFRVVACAFRRVVLRGRIENNVMIVPDLDPWSGNPQAAYARANGEHWVDLICDADWALDISEVSGNLDYRGGIPARLIRRDPETQVVMTSAQAVSGAWRAVRGIERTLIGVNIEVFLGSGYRETVLIADKSSADCSKQINVLRELQRIGAAMPD